MNSLSAATAFLSRAGLLRPPGLRTDEEERSASWLELFFDLAFVLVVAELASALGKDFSLKGILTFAGLFAVTWWSWASSTLYANRFDTDDLVYRLFKLCAMVAVIGMAASAAEATGKNAVAFAASYVVVRVVLFLQYTRVYRALPEARPIVRLYLIGAGAGALLWAASLVAPPPVRYTLWGLGLLVDVIVPFAATFAPGAVPLHLEHLPERMALFLILVLGESVGAVVHGVHDELWTTQAIAVGAVSFLLTAALWWTIFDLAGAAAKKLLLERGGGGELASDVFVYGHLFVALGLATVGVGIEHVILESNGEDATALTRGVLCGGVALFLLAISATNSAMAGDWRSGWWWPVLAAVVAVANALATLPAVVVVGALALLVTGVAVTGIVQESRGRIELEAL